jgi:pentose-5-phosphate-3-epimerase
MQDVQQAIRERAYQIWIDGGCQDNQADAHWLAAQREVLAASLGGNAAEKTTKSKKANAKKRRVA